MNPNLYYKDYNQIFQAAIGLNYITGSLRKDCLELGTIYMYAQNESLKKVKCGELYLNENQSFLLESALPKCDNLDVSTFVHQSLLNIHQNIMDGCGDWLRKSILKGREKADIRSVNARYYYKGNEEISRVHFKEVAPC